MESDDPLLSVAQVARMWGTGLDIVVELVDSMTLPSLDRGELISQGHLDVPLIRRSWAEFLSLDGDASARIIEPSEGERVHPAFIVALDVHSALDEGDAETLYQLSSKASREGRDPAALYSRWIECTQGGFPTDSGVGSTIYTLAPLPALAARVFADAPKVPRAITRSAPARLLAVLPLVEEKGEWKVDLPMFEGPAFLPEVLTSPLPKETLPAEDEVENQEDEA
ncbi:MAG: hypothetical protein QOE56_2655 [Solirubrobacterales bacterium]|jgi:hypothetical protein|nr:hypothetical protein [Solirubrobacterales bacterium]